MEKFPKYLYEFGPFRLDAANRLLLRDGEIVPLKPKVFDTLLVFVEQPGQVISKNELMERIWQDTVVEENNLTQNISMLRKILGKDSSGQDYIRTIPRRGYCFTSSVQEVWEDTTDFILAKSSRARIVVEEEQDSSDPPVNDTEISVRAGASNHSPVSELSPLSWSLSITLTALSAFVIGLVIIGAGLIFSSQPNKKAAQSSPGVVQIATWKSAPRESELRNGTFSPDGAMIAFSSNRANHSAIFIKQVEGGEAVEIIGDEWHNESPIWSPDGQQIAFVSDRGSHPGIWSIPTLGGNLTLLTDLKNGWPELKRWSGKTSSIYYEAENNLFILDLISKRTTQVTNFDSTKLSPPHFSISPEEDRLAYSDDKNGQQDIWVMPLRGGEPTQVTDDPADDRHPIWHPSGESIIYNSNRRGVYQICIAYVDGQPPAQITVEDTNNAISDISPDGSKILFVASREEADLLKVEDDSGEETALTSDFGLELWPDVSSDGKTIAFQSASAKVKIFTGSILSKPVESSGRQFELATDGFDPRWSPDGSNLGFLRFSNNLYNIWAVKATGGEHKQLTRDGVIFGGFSGLPYNRRQTSDYSWSPDGSKIAYCSMKSGQVNVWAVDVNNSSDTMISNNDDPNLTLVCPLWSPDGKRIAYITIPGARSADGKYTQSVRVTESGTSNIIFQSDTSLRLIGWSESGHDLIVAAVKDTTKPHPTTAQIDLFQISVSGGESHQIASLASAYFNNIKLSPDRRSIAFVSRLDGQDNIYTIGASGGEATKITKNNDSRAYFSSLVCSPDGKAIYCSRQASWSLISMMDNLKRKDLVSWQKPQNPIAK
jgi:Tol biopolymer transport system component/DNA-binding winged helix-turn-helix (wHTH) protein